MKLSTFLLPCAKHESCYNTVILSIDNPEDNPEMWDLTPDLEDIIKPLSRPEPPQTSTTRALNNQEVIQDGVLHSLCHQMPPEKPGAGYQQTCSTHQHVLGSRDLWKKILGLIL